MPTKNGRHAYWWEGDSLCIGKSATGEACGNFEVEGMDYCMHHMPDDLLEEAEGVTGVFRCRHEPSCGMFAVAGTKPPRCQRHGANAGGVISKQAAVRVTNEQVDEQFRAIIAMDGERLLNPARLTDPLTELLDLGAEMKVFKNMLREIVSTMQPQTWRYSKSAGEQVVGYLILYERALERLARILIEISKLDIIRLMARIEERKVDMIERALMTALESTGLDLEKQHTAKLVLARELQAADSAA